MFYRKVHPVRFDEFTARALLALIENEEERLRGVEAGAEGRADRLAWAMTRLARIRLSKARTRLEAVCNRLAPPSQEERARFAKRVGDLALRMPQPKRRKVTPGVRLPERRPASGAA